ncbi:MAG: SAM-dependent methyltransferase [Tissierellia bacterium]|nr:SAM-dependent methyltransferase [Tissierellia bacterium]
MNRLECIVSMVDKCSTAADIGTDHGYVAEMLLKEGKCDKVIATDLNKGPLSRAMEHLYKVNLRERCDFRLGSGLTVLKEGEADAIIIAGMGGDLISDILEASKNIALNTDQLILQPMTAAESLRRYLAENGFEIRDEKIVKEYHHFYFIIKANKGFIKYEDTIYYEISKSLIEKNDPIMIEYINKVLNTNKKIIGSLEKTNNVEYNVKIDSLREKNKKIKELIK